MPRMANKLEAIVAEEVGFFCDSGLDRRFLGCTELVRSEQLSHNTLTTRRHAPLVPACP
jgi:hypothetical protein